MQKTSTVNVRVHVCLPLATTKVDPCLSPIVAYWYNQNNVSVCNRGQRITGSWIRCIRNEIVFYANYVSDDCCLFSRAHLKQRPQNIISTAPKIFRIEVLVEMVAGSIPIVLSPIVLSLHSHNLISLPSLPLPISFQQLACIWEDEIRRWVVASIISPRYTPTMSLLWSPQNPEHTRPFLWMSIGELSWEERATNHTRIGESENSDSFLEQEIYVR